ncbi:nuclear hormone receptor FTZ-F1-like isoform X2 [Centruroides sculpturatus]|uniref:nuclear hormone receptor FTZ-F1-like isoform X2 n=1 Tax=Centruroides sculpturatus TaxID=218467 RepID=UPI000C6DF159|nr:nuclear hormone receptor FTZ-F1-like isoform X2 [Centruroides sculpturatus]
MSCEPTTSTATSTDVSATPSMLSGPTPTPTEYHHDTPDTKEGIEELCPVCGDTVSGYHYGLLTCESCKGFFKRTVQNKKVYTCVAERKCHIDKSQRKRCPFCRFQKCLEVGMKLEAVRADRMRGGRNKFGPMYKRDRARKLQLLRQKQLARNQCQGVPATEGGMNNPLPSHPPSFTASTGPAGVTAPQQLYSPETVSMKQELIQIPHLSSSTNSPESSPSPLSAIIPVTTLGSHYSGPQPTRIHPQAPVVQEPSKLTWVTSHAPQNTTPSPGHGASPPVTNAAPSPKTYHYDVPSAANVPPPSVSLMTGIGKIPNLIREFQSCMADDKDWQNQVYSLLQSQSYNQCEVDLFELMCKVIDQSLFFQVDWARNSIFFKDLKVDDQMKLLQHAWSDMLILDHLHQRLHNGLPDETTLPNGQKFDMLCLALLGLPAMADQLHRVATRLQTLKFDPLDYICLKFIVLLNPEIRGLSNMKLVHEAYEQTQQALLEYTMNCYPQVTEKFNQLMQVLPEIKVISMRGEEYLYYKHINSSIPAQTLLMEMLHAKKK